MNELYGYSVENFMGQLPSALYEDSRMYALSRAIASVLVAHIRQLPLAELYSNLDGLPEFVIDFIAEELKTPFYNVSLPAGEKRVLVWETPSYYRTNGTLGACKRILQAIYPGSQIEEWFDYDGQPYCFRVHARNDVRIRELQGFDEFLRLIDTVKRLAAKLESVIVDADPADTPLRVGASGAIAAQLSPVERPDDLSATRTLRIGGQAAVVASLAPTEQPDNLSVTRTLRAGGALAPTAFRAVPATPDSLTVRNALRFGGRLAFTHSLAIPAKAIDYYYPHTLKDAQSVGGTPGVAASRAVLPVPDTPNLSDIQRIGGKISGVTATFSLAENADAPLFHTLRTGGLTEISTRLPVPAAPEITDFPSMETRFGTGLTAERIAEIGVPAVDNAPELYAVLRVGTAPETLTEIAVPERNGNAAAYAIRTGGQSERETYVPIPEIR